MTGIERANSRLPFTFAARLEPFMVLPRRCSNPTAAPLLVAISFQAISSMLSWSAVAIFLNVSTVPSCTPVSIWET